MKKTLRLLFLLLLTNIVFATESDPVQDSKTTKVETEKKLDGEP